MATRLSVLGAGAWGTAVAMRAASQGVSTCLWARDAQAIARMRSQHENQRYLPGVPLPGGLQLTHELSAALAHARGEQGVLIVATPMSALREMLSLVPPDQALWWLCKGLERDSGMLASELAQQLRPRAAHGVLSGPSFAIEVAQGRPTALVAASQDGQLAQQAVEALHSDCLRVYTSLDPVGVEIGGAVKNVLAIATGIADGLDLGLNARAALITRGLAEMTRLGLALGAQSDTFMGLSGLGDLVLTATGGPSRNRRVGLELAQGKPLETILHDLGHVAEGVYCATAIAKRAQDLGVSMPITQAVVDVLEARLTPVEAVSGLMRRQATTEGFGARV